MNITSGMGVRTMTKPTKEGWYWCKQGKGEDWEPVHVWDTGELRAMVVGSYLGYKLDRPEVLTWTWGEPVAPNGTRAEIASIARKMRSPKKMFGYRRGFNKCRGIASGHIVEILNNW